MKVALIHELLTMRGGAERVFKIISEMYPEAPIYTLLYDEKKLGDWFPKSRVRTPERKFRSNNHHRYLNQFPEAVQSWDFSEFDLVISSSSAFAHGIITNGKPKHLCYVHSPARYLWDRTHDVLDRAGKGMLGPIKRRYLERIFHKLRVWDTESSARPDKLLAASKEVQRRIELYWRRESEVLYPPVDDSWLESGSGSGSDFGMENPDYFLIVSTLVDYKRIDLAIEACNKTKQYLKIVGEGPAINKLKKIAGPTIEFYGYRENDELKDIVANAKAIIFPGKEDFGLVPIESMSQGTPVIAFRGGGALETISEGRTGSFFDEFSSDSLAKVLTNFNPDVFHKDLMLSAASKYSRKVFEDKLNNTINELF
ncbi:MAG: glycosyltransferase [Candidatus Peribacteraceae bacterium]|jgi:glycosyltransferase involved in cell wall biosynthesis|nr:glycosyltransferase [Candidatus Peribacteraceae bacterium]MDP7454497.1 glycosyltransferase [Candidatus Peribacteraceae bacterium]|tara:strand:+ start:2989 stop:4095 length:1107 start_codon:yes stop_codon:yes gene_type:complete